MRMKSEPKQIWLVRDKTGRRSYKIAFHRKPNRRTDLKDNGCGWSSWTCGYSPYFWKELSNIRLRPGAGPVEICIMKKTGIKAMTKLETELAEVLKSLVPDYMDSKFLDDLDSDDKSGTRFACIDQPTIATMRRVLKVLEKTK